MENRRQGNRGQRKRPQPQSQSQEEPQRRLGGFTMTARDLTEKRGKLVTRQGVYAWWRRRDRNGFPGRHPYTTRSGKSKERFDMDEVLRWYDYYMSIPWQGRKK